MASVGCFAWRSIDCVSPLACFVGLSDCVSQRISSVSQGSATDLMCLALEYARLP